jgi:hypothetical protein
MRLAALLLLIATPALAQQLTQPQPSPGTLPSDTITTRELSAIIAERDRQYAQRFEAQQKAVDAALAAAEKAVAAALAAQEKATAAAFAAANEAVKTAQMANEKRLDSVNEFRGQLKDQASTLATRTEVDVRFKALTDKLDTLDTAITEQRSRMEGASTLWTGIAVAVGLLLSITIAAMAIFRRRHTERTEA